MKVLSPLSTWMPIQQQQQQQQHHTMRMRGSQESLLLSQSQQLPIHHHHSSNSNIMEHHETSSTASQHHSSSSGSSDKSSIINNRGGSLSNGASQKELLKRLQNHQQELSEVITGSSSSYSSRVCDTNEESEYMPCEPSGKEVVVPATQQQQKQQQYYHSHQNNAKISSSSSSSPAPQFVASSKPFHRRLSMQVIHSSAYDNAGGSGKPSTYARRAGERRGSIPCIATAVAEGDEISSGLRTSQTAPNPFPELIINSPPPVSPLVSHGRSQSSCIDDRPYGAPDYDYSSSLDEGTGTNSNSNAIVTDTNKSGQSSQCVYTSQSSDETAPTTNNYFFSHSQSTNSLLVSSTSLSSISSTSPLIKGASPLAPPYTSSSATPMSPPPPHLNHSYVHSSVIAARAKHILDQCSSTNSNSSPSNSPMIPRRRISSTSSTSPLVTASSTGTLSESNSTNGLSGYYQSSSSPQSDSPNGSTTGRISPDRMSCLYEQSSALWSAQGYTKQMLMVHTDENNYKTVTIEENQEASDVSRMLVEKCKAAADKSWSVVERLPKFNLERSLEDHELVYAIYRSWGKAENNRFYFQKDFKKYELFSNPAQFLPPHMLDWKDGTSPKSSPKLSQKSSERHTNLLFKNLLTEGERLPDIQGNIYMKEGRKSWKKHFFVLRNSGLYYSSKGNSKEPKHLVLFSHLNDVNIYTANNSKKVLNSPNNYCICLKPTYCVTDAKELKLLCAEDENSRMSWLAALRLIKYGNQLKENFKKAAKLERSLASDSKENSPRNYTGGKLNVRARVAMDFTGHGGRVVDDPIEAVGVAIEEGQHWRKKAPRGHHSPAMVDSPCQATGFLSENPNKCHHGLLSGVHMTLPWFHSGITRDEAVQLIHSDGVVDGVFLVRESQSIPGFYVLSLAHNGKVKHCTIKTFDYDGDLYFSMDGGHTKFLDIIQLVEFYQLNANGLPTKLAHYVSRVV